MWPRKLGVHKCMVHGCWDYGILCSVSCHTYILGSLPVNEDVLRIIDWLDLGQDPHTNQWSPLGLLELSLYKVLKQ